MATPTDGDDITNPPVTVAQPPAPSNDAGEEQEFQSKINAFLNSLSTSEKEKYNALLRRTSTEEPFQRAPAGTILATGDLKFDVQTELEANSVSLRGKMNFPATKAETASNIRQFLLLLFYEFSYTRSL